MAIICLLDKGTKFEGKIRFQNLTKEELGLLLWALKLKPESWMNVGKAKAFGYGCISLKIKDAKVVDLEKAYSIAGALVLDPYENIKVEEMIESYKEAINKFLDGRNIEEMPHIKEFFMMKDSTMIPAKDDIRYMKIRNTKEKQRSEYQNRKRPLPTAKEVVNKKKS